MIIGKEDAFLIVQEAPLDFHVLEAIRPLQVFAQRFAEMGSRWEMKLVMTA